MCCNYRTGLSFAWIKVTPIHHYPKNLYHVSLNMNIDKYLGSYTDKFLIEEIDENQFNLLNKELIKE